MIRTRVNPFEPRRQTCGCRLARRSRGCGRGPWRRLGRRRRRCLGGSGRCPGPPSSWARRGVSAQHPSRRLRFRADSRPSPYDSLPMAVPLTTRSQWLAANPPAARDLTQSLVGVALRVRRGENFHPAVREFLDEFVLRADDRSRFASISARPLPTGDARYDAYLGALAEHLAVAHGLDRPPWATEPARFLDRFWFVSDVPGFRAVSIAQAPAAFRRRGVFVPERSLHRV